MFNKVDNFFHSLFLLIVLFYSLLAMVQSSSECETCIENGKMTDLIEKFYMLQAEMKSQKTEINQLKSENKELKGQLSQQGEKIILLETGIPKQKSSCPPKPTDSCTNKMKDNVASKTNEKPSSKALDLLPTSCDGLRENGHFADGVYLVLNEETKKIDAVFCQFPGANKVLETLIGDVDVKTQNVHFSVSSSYPVQYGTNLDHIPFQNALLNIGEALDLETGSFVAPVSGTYHFEFYGIGKPGLYFYYRYDHGDGFGGESVAAPYNAPYGAPGNTGPVGFSASLRLQKGDKMILQMEEGSFSSGIEGPITFYTGWLVEEELE